MPSSAAASVSALASLMFTVTGACTTSWPSSGGAALANPALTVGVSFLDDVQVDLLVQATQADQRNVILTAPRLTLFNGQRAWIAVAKATT